NATVGAVFIALRPTGELLPPSPGGRHPIVTRIIWLRVLETGNRNAYEREIYIHGTPVENLIGRPASYGCIRMRSRDIIQLFASVGVGARINVLNVSVGRAITTLAANGHRVLAQG